MEIFGYTEKEIMDWQQRKPPIFSVDRKIYDPKTGRRKPSEEDYALLEKWGIHGLREQGYFGVLDRLTPYIQEALS